MFDPHDPLLMALLIDAMDSAAWDMNNGRACHIRSANAVNRLISESATEERQTQRSES